MYDAEDHLEESHSHIIPEIIETYWPEVDWDDIRDSDES